MSILSWFAGKSPIGVGIGIGIERSRMTFGHEKLDVYRPAIEYVGWIFRLCERLKSIPIPIPIPTPRKSRMQG